MTQMSLHNAGHLLDSYLTELKTRGSVPELSISSLPNLNQTMWGLKKRRLTTIAARPSHGKSAFGLQLALDLALQNKVVLFLSLEMESLECFERLMTSMGRINNVELRTDRSKNHVDVIRQNAEVLKTKRFLISDQIGRTWKEIDNLIEEASQSDHHIDAVFLDYVQNTKDEGKNSLESLNEYIRHLREMSIRHNFAAVLMSQINRTSNDAKDKRPQLWQMKGTGVLEEHSDVCLLLNYPSKYDLSVDPTEFHIHLDKNKMGLTTSFKIKYYADMNVFAEPTFNDNPQIKEVPLSRYETPEEWRA